MNNNSALKHLSRGSRKLYRKTSGQGVAQGGEGQDRGQGPVSLASANVDAGGPPEPIFVFFVVVFLLLYFCCCIFVVVFFLYFWRG